MSSSLPPEDLEDLYETAPCGYVSLTPDARIAKINRTLCEWLEQDPARLVGQSVHDILSFGGRIAFETHLAPLLRMQGHILEIALDLVTSSGTKIPTIANAAEKRSEDGSHRFTRLTLFKAVDRRTYERSLLEARLKAEAESKVARENALLREQFIAVLGHDLRNPLASIDAGLEVLRRRIALDPAAERIFGEMHRSVERADSMIGDLLDFARGRLGGGIPVDRQPTLLSPFLEQVLSEIRAIAPGHRIESTLTVDRPVSCDGDRLSQLASNLLANAAAHSPEGSLIRLEAIADDHQFSLCVANQGPPIPPEVRERLFQPFFRGDVRSSRNGLGLGLFIVSEIAKAHDGRLDVQSDEHETLFLFSMPDKAPA